MEKFCAITPTRGDRPQFLKHCKMQMKRQTVQPGDHFIIDFRPESEAPDLTDRVKVGLEMARLKNYDIVYIIEDDDYYPDNYFEKMQLKPHESFIGIENTLYYNIINNKYSILEHPNNSSLFCTGLRLSAMRIFKWPNNSEVFLDQRIWNFARWTCHKLINNFKQFNAGQPIGIKHGIGLCGGVAHNTNFPYQFEDLNKTLLKETISPESFKFYNSLY
jgi:hypothetical protein